jgi:hypothetical protein
VELGRYLPPPADPLRPLALRELIKTDLEIRWRRGLGVTLEFYLSRFPELGPAQVLSPELVYEEYAVRHRHGDRPALAIYQERFPDQFGRLVQMIQDRATPVLDTPSTFSSGSGSGSARKSGPPAGSGPTPSAVNVLRASGDYRMLQRIGEGAFGEVWRAEGPGGTEVAVKIISRPLSHVAAQQELKSLEQVKRLRHPYLVQTQAYWAVDERLYIVMDLADGSLTDRANQCRAQGLPGIPPDELLQYFREAAEALDYLHAEQVHHRDVKPANILLLKGHAKLADFGLARLLQTGHSVTEGTMCGTPAFMAPELWHGKVSPNSDQWSLAVTYAELRLNRGVFKERTLVSLMVEICESEPDLSPLGEPEQQVLRKALAHDHRERYSTCKDFVLALQEALQSRPAAPAGGAPAWKNAGPDRWGWSRWAVVLVAALLALSLPGAFVLSRWRFPHASTEVAPAGLRLEDPAPLMVATGRETTFPLHIHRQNFDGPVELSVLDANDLCHVKVTLPTVGPGEDRGIVRVAVDQEAPAGTQKVRIRTSEGFPPAEAVVELTILDLPPACEPVGTATKRDGKGVAYYAQIARRLEDGTRIPFVVVPRKSPEERRTWKRDPETFFISQDKITRAVFRKFAASHPGKANPRWQKNGTGEEMPVLEVSVEEAYACARWLGGNLPTVEQWDKAAGLYERDRGEGPYRGKWDDKVRPDVAVRLTGPRPVGFSRSDVSRYGCRDMAGNGWEWTRTLTLGKGLVPVLNPGSSLLDYGVYLRGQNFREEKPLTYADLEDGLLPSATYQEPNPDTGFRVVIEP